MEVNMAAVRMREATVSISAYTLDRKRRSAGKCAERSRVHVLVAVRKTVYKESAAAEILQS